MQVHAVILEHRRIDAEVLGMGPQIRLGGACRLLHHFAELSRDRKSMTAGQQVRFDEKNFTAHLSYSHPRCNSRGQFFTCFFRIKLWRAEKIVDDISVDDYFFGLALGDLQRHFTRDASDGSLELAYSGFARVTRRDQTNGSIGDFKLLRRQSVLAHLT